MSARAFAIFMAVLGVVALLGFGLASKGSKALEVGESAPTGELEVLGGSGSGSIADHRGNWVLANVWASWCLPCRDEAPVLERFHRRHRDRELIVLGINTEDLTDDALAFVDEFHLTYPQLRDGDGEFARDELGTTGVPESFLIDPRGRLALHRPGPVTEEYLEVNVKPFLVGEASP